MFTYAFLFTEFEYLHHTQSGWVRHERMIMCRAGSITKVYFITQGGKHSGWHGGWSYITTKSGQDMLIAFFNWRGEWGQDTCMVFSRSDGHKEDGEFEVIDDHIGWMGWNGKKELVTMRARSLKSVMFNCLDQLV